MHASLKIILPALTVAVVMSYFNHHQNQLEILTLTKTAEELRSTLAIKKSAIDSLEKENARLSLELANQKNKKEVNTDATSNVPAVGHQNNNNSFPQETSSSDNNDFAAQARISAIEKFVPLNESQKLRLQAKFDADKKLPGSGESLEKILGDQSANFYKEQRKKSFEKAKSENLEKEVLFIARRLQMDMNQEQQLRELLITIEDEVANTISEDSENRDPKSMLKRILEQDRMRTDLMAQKLKTILNAEQYKKYIEEEAESSKQDMQVWHSPS